MKERGKKEKETHGLRQQGLKCGEVQSLIYVITSFFSTLINVVLLMSASLSIIFYTYLRVYSSN